MITIILLFYIKGVFHPQNGRIFCEKSQFSLQMATKHF